MFPSKRYPRLVVGRLGVKVWYGIISVNKGLNYFLALPGEYDFLLREVVLYYSCREGFPEE